MGTFTNSSLLSIVDWTVFILQFWAFRVSTVTSSVLGFRRLCAACVIAAGPPLRQRRGLAGFTKYCPSSRSPPLMINCCPVLLLLDFGNVTHL